MKLTSAIYHNNVFHLVKSWGKSHRVYESVNKKTQNETKIQFFSPNFDHSLLIQEKTVAYLTHRLAFITGQKFRLLLGSSGQKTTKKQPKIAVFASAKTCENLNLENYQEC